MSFDDVSCCLAVFSAVKNVTPRRGHHHHHRVVHLQNHQQHRQPINSVSSYALRHEVRIEY